MFFRGAAARARVRKIFLNKNSLTLSDFRPLIVQKIHVVPSVSLAGADHLVGQTGSVPSGAELHTFMQEDRIIKGGPGGGPGGGPSPLRSPEIPVYQPSQAVGK